MSQPPEPSKRGKDGRRMHPNSLLNLSPTPENLPNLRRAGRGASFGGKLAQLRLRPSKATTHPTGGSPGDFFVDSTARLWFCKGGGVWKQLA